MAVVEPVDDHTAYLEASGTGALVLEVTSALLEVRPPEPMWLSFVVQHFADKAEPPPALGRAYLKLAQAAATGCANHDSALDVLAAAYDCFARERSCGGPCATDYTALLAALLDPFEAIRDDCEAQETSASNTGSSNRTSSSSNISSAADRMQTLLVPRSMASSLAAAQARSSAATSRRQANNTTTSIEAASSSSSSTAATATAATAKEIGNQNNSTATGGGGGDALTTNAVANEEGLLKSDQNDNDNEDVTWPEPPPEVVPFPIFATGLGALLRCLRVLHEACAVWQRVLEEETKSNSVPGEVVKAVSSRALVSACTPWNGADVGASGVAFAPSLKLNASDLIRALAVATATTATTTTSRDATRDAHDAAGAGAAAAAAAANARMERLRHWVVEDNSSSNSSHQQDPEEELDGRVECSALDVEVACAAACERALRDVAGGAFMWAP